MKRYADISFRVTERKRLLSPGAEGGAASQSTS